MIRCASRYKGDEPKPPRISAVTFSRVCNCYCLFSVLWIITFRWKMSPLVIVGLILVTSTLSNGDVSHILNDSSPPPSNFWWMNSNSPLKAAYDYYKKCTNKANCLPANVPQPFRPPTDAGSVPTVDIKNNPFLNGGLQTGGAHFNDDQSIDISKNPFLSGVVTTGSGTPIVKDLDGFLGVQPAQPFRPSANSKKPGFATTHPLEQKQPFAVNHPLDEECRGAGFICVERALCANGVVNKNGEGLLQARTDVQYCNRDKEVCCRLDNNVPDNHNQKLTLHLPNLIGGGDDDVITAGKSSVLVSEKITSTTLHNNNDDDSPIINLSVQPVNQYGTSVKSIRDTSVTPSGTVDYSDTKFDDVRFASTFQGPAYLPPVGPSSKPPTIQTYQPSVPTTTTPRPHNPYEVPVIVGPEPTPYPSRPSTSFEYIPPKKPVVTPPPPVPVTSNRDYLPPRVTSPTNNINNEYVPSRPTTNVTPRPYQPSVTPQRPYQPSVTPQRPYQPSTSRPYQPSITPQQPYQPSVTPQQPYQPSVTPQRPKPYQPSITPYQPSVTPSPSHPSSNTREYLPPHPSTPFVPQPSSPRPNPFIPQYTTPRPTYEQPTNPPSPSETPSYKYPKPSTPYQPRPTPPPYQPTYTRPTPPPYQPSPSGTPSYSYPKPSTPFQPRPTPSPYQPTQTRPTLPPYQPSPSGTPSYTYPKPSSPFQTRPTPKPYQPTYQPSPSGTPSYTYPKPSTPYQPRPTPPPYHPTQPKPTPPPYEPNPSVTPGYDYPKPSTPFNPRPTPYQPSPSSTSSVRYPSPSITPGYEYSKPSTPFQPRPTPSRPQITNGYPSNTNPQYETTNYHQPSTSRPTYYPTTSKPFVTPTRPIYTQPPVTPGPNPSSGYVYAKPTPSFELPTRSPSTPRYDGSNIENVYISTTTTTRQPNIYLPPINGSETNPTPTRVSPPPRDHDYTGQPNNENPFVLKPTTPRTTYTGDLNTAPPSSCAAALKCVQEIYCTADGFVSPVPVVLTKEQEFSRVPTTVCEDKEAGIIGKCCRDPNYKDPWPSANLVNGEDDGQYKEDNNFGAYTPDLQRSVRRSDNNPGGPRQDYSSIQQATSQQLPSCGNRHFNTKPPGQGPLDVNFAEIPWQAMILRDSNRSLLCGGAIIRRDAVLTAAHCIEGLETSDILIKGGEWKLGIDEEPLPFQIVKVSVVIRHPQYKLGSYVNDLAVLILEEKLRPAKNIGTICLPPPNQIPTENCIATGWGKRILQLHAKGAIMHSINVKIMDTNQCQETLSTKFQHAVDNYSPNTLCGYSNVDQCRVDYGSALACTTGNDQYTLSGIYAWDTGCKQEGQIGGYIAPDVDWIETTLAKPLKELKKNERDYLQQQRN